MAKADARLDIRLPACELAAVDAAKDVLGQTRSDFMRRAGLAAARRVLSSTVEGEPMENSE